MSALIHVHCPEVISELFSGIDILLRHFATLAQKREQDSLIFHRGLVNPTGIFLTEDSLDYCRETID